MMKTRLVLVIVSSLLLVATASLENEPLSPLPPSLGGDNSTSDPYDNHTFIGRSEYDIYTHTTMEERRFVRLGIFGALFLSIFVKFLVVTTTDTNNCKWYAFEAVFGTDVLLLTTLFVSAYYGVEAFAADLGFVTNFFLSCRYMARILYRMFRKELRGYVDKSRDERSSSTSATIYEENCGGLFREFLGHILHVLFVVIVFGSTLALVAIPAAYDWYGFSELSAVGYHLFSTKAFSRPSDAYKLLFTFISPLTIDLIYASVKECSNLRKDKHYMLLPKPAQIVTGVLEHGIISGSVLFVITLLVQLNQVLYFTDHFLLMGALQVRPS